MPEWICLGNPASSFGEAAYGQPVTVGWWRPRRGPLLKEREKGRTPSCFAPTIQETRVTLPALIGPTRPVPNLFVRWRLVDHEAGRAGGAASFGCNRNLAGLRSSGNVSSHLRV